MKSLFRAALERRDRKARREAKALAEAIELVDGDALPEVVMDKMVNGLLRDIMAQHEAMAPDVVGVANRVVPR